jgi:hypothetical protein
MTVAANGVGEVGDGPGPRVPHTCIGTAFSAYIVAVLCIIHVLLSVTDNNEGIEKVSVKACEE